MTLLSYMDVCHAAAFLYMTTKNTVPQSHAMRRGSLWHQMREEAVEHMVKEGEVKMAGEIAKDRMQGLIRANNKPALPEYEQNACRGMAFNWGEATIIDPAAILANETMFEMEIGGWPVRGKIDFAEMTLEGHLRVNDDKTQLDIPPEDKVRKGRPSFQLKFYGMLGLYGAPEGETLGIGSGINYVDARLTFPRHRNKETGELIYREVTYERTADLADFRQTIESHLSALEDNFKTGEWEASPGDPKQPENHCNRCPMRSMCPIPSDLNITPEIQTRQQAIDAVAQIEQNKATLKPVQAGLKSFIAENGPVPIPDEEKNMDLVYQATNRVDKETGEVQKIHSTVMRKAAA